MLSDKAYLALTIVTSAIIVALMSVLGVPWWVGVAICLPIILGGLLVKHQLESKRPPEPPQQVQYQPPPPPPPAPAPAMSTGVPGLALPSAHPDYRFIMNATVLWRASGTQGVAHPRPAQLAVDAIHERATRLTEGEAAAESDLLGPRIATELSFPRPDRTGQLEAWAQDVLLTIPDDDRRRLQKLAEVRKDEEVWEHERAYERNKRAYLREDVLSTTGSAVVWWLAQDTTRVQETVGLIGTLAQLVAAAQNREVEPVFRMFMNGLTGSSTPSFDDIGEQAAPGAGEDVVARLMATMLPGNASEPERAALADGLAGLAAEAGAADFAASIRERFNAPDFTEAPEPALFDVADDSGGGPSPVHPNGLPEPGPHDPA